MILLVYFIREYYNGIFNQKFNMKITVDCKDDINTDKLNQKISMICNDLNLDVILL